MTEGELYDVTAGGARFCGVDPGVTGGRVRVVGTSDGGTPTSSFVFASDADQRLMADAIASVVARQAA